MEGGSSPQSGTAAITFTCIAVTLPLHYRHTWCRPRGRRTVTLPLRYRHNHYRCLFFLRQEGSAPPLIPCHAAAASPRHEYPHVAASQPHRNRLPVAQPRVCVSLFSPFGSPCILDSTRDEAPESEPVRFCYYQDASFRTPKRVALSYNQGASTWRCG